MKRNLIILAIVSLILTGVATFMVLGSNSTISIPSTVTIIQKVAGGGSGFAAVEPPKSLPPVSPAASAVRIYADSALTEEITSIIWGSIEQGSVKSKTVYVKDTGNTALSVSVNTTGLPSRLILTTQGGLNIAVSENISLTLTMTVDPQAPVASSNFTTTFTHSTTLLPPLPFVYVTNDDSYDQTPDVVKCPDGSLLTVYRKGKTDGTDKGVLVAKRSTDNGLTWSSQFPVYSDSTWDVQTPSLTLLSNGTILCSFWLCDYHHPYFLPSVSIDYESIPIKGGSRLIRSTDNGTTWSDVTAITDNFTSGSYTSCRVLELSPGNLMALVSGVDSGSSYYSTHFLTSKDWGHTWQGETTIANGQSDSRNYHEPCLVMVGSKLIAMLRSDSNQIFQSVSDNGTWSKPTLAFVGSGKPAVIRLGNGRLLVTYRSAVKPFLPVLRLSTNGGVTWGNEIVLDKYGCFTVYVSALEVSPGKVLAVYGQVTLSDAQAHIRFKDISGLIGG